MSVFDHKAVVWDLDGTLYFQRDMRIRMAAALLLYYLIHPFSVRELLAVKRFREIREAWSKKDENDPKLSETAERLKSEDPGLDGLSALQYAKVSADTGTPPRIVKKAVDMWIYDKPLKIIYKCRDKRADELIKLLTKKGTDNYIFSDYPIEDKLRALKTEGIKGTYAATDERVGVLKPDPRGLKLIMEDHGLVPGDILMIGDRMSRDGEAAKNAGCDYFILSKSRIKRIMEYKKLTGE
ncbi:MAG: HAD family hydrolase [Lachnospiraceae bacterium]|nr:HAD family hydrolase [Lachnospiraceae bacterium]